jgi:hypothetical protein
MRISSSGARLVPALVLACALSACGGGSGSGGGFFGGTPLTPAAPAHPRPRRTRHAARHRRGPRQKLRTVTKGPAMNSRRKFLTGTATTGAAALALSAFPPSIRRALAIPANNATGTIMDVEHVVILMQENRSFDHYFGTLPGVRGFGDRFTIPLPAAATCGSRRWGTATS